MAKMEIVRELWEFMRERKRYWLAPIVFILVLFGLLLVFIEGSAVAPLIYTVF